MLIAPIDPVLHVDFHIRIPVSVAAFGKCLNAKSSLLLMDLSSTTNIKIQEHNILVCTCIAYSSSNCSCTDTKAVD